MSGEDFATVRSVLDVYLAQQRMQSPQAGIVVTTGAYINGAMESLAALDRLEARIAELQAAAPSDELRGE